MIAFAWSVPEWAWILPTSMPGPELAFGWAFPFIPFAHFYFMLSVLRLFCFPLVFEYESYKAYFSNTSGTMSIIRHTCQKIVYFSRFGLYLAV